MNKHRIGALIAAAALTLTFAGTAFADHTIALGASGTDQSGECDGDYFKVESTSSLAEGTHDYTGTTKDGASFSATLTVTLDDEGEVESIVVVETDPAYTLIVFKAGNVFYTEDGATLTPDNGKAISNLAFCLETTTTTTTTDVVTTTTDVVTTTTDVVTTTTDVVTTTTDVVTTTTDDIITTTTAPEGSVEELTPPQTDTIGQPTSSSSVSTGLLLVLAGILAAVLVVVPAAARNRR
jgi:hypothetical protein